MVAFHVAPADLHQAATEFHDSSDAAGDAAALLEMLSLDPDALGQVPAAAEFADALTRFAGAHADDLRRGAAWLGDTGAGLTDNAHGYQRADDSSQDGFRGIQAELS